jgi:predicted amidohydrolase YtcJ
MMKKLTAILVSLVFVGLMYGPVQVQEKADLVVMNGRIFTIAEENPVIMRRRRGHAVWVNSVVLEMSDITKDSEVPEGGEIVIDPKTGEPTGILKEAAASLVKVHGEVNPKEDIERALKQDAWTR